jgi:hypothetical protein
VIIPACAIAAWRLFEQAGRIAAHSVRERGRDRLATRLPTIAVLRCEATGSPHLVQIVSRDFLHVYVGK